MTALMEIYEPPAAERISLVPSGERLSLIARSAAASRRDWKCGSAVRLIPFIEGDCTPGVALGGILHDPSLDLARVIVEGVSETRSFLNVLASMPPGSGVEILWICDDGGGYLSSVGRAGDRVLYGLQPADVRFYLEVHDLVVERQVIGASPRGVV